MTMLTTAAAANVANVVSLPSAAAASVVPAGCSVQGQAWRAREVSEGEANGCTGLWTAGASDRAGGRGGAWNTGTRNRGPSPSGDRDTTDSADYYSIIIYIGCGPCFQAESGSVTRVRCLHV